ncbi:MAG: hypothetical protein ABSH45_07785 [Bryobacteraceae bacterium]|jgi:hypothetical protein
MAAMTDWKALAHAAGLAGDAQALERITQPLETIEAVFRPLTENLPPELEPACTFDPEEDAE